VGRPAPSVLDLMKIHSAETLAVRVDFEGAIAGTHIVLRLRTVEGPEGISYVSRVTPRTLKPLSLLIEAMAQSLIDGDPIDSEAIYAKLYAPVLGAEPAGLELRAASAVDVAVWDLRGKALGQPLHRLMGGFRPRVPISANWGLMPGPSPDKIARHVERLLARGFRVLKCPVGLVDLHTAVTHVKLVRQCAGPDIRIIVDGNFGWSVKDAIRFARETEDCDLYWIEDPVSSHDLAGLKRVTDAIAQKTCGGEVFQHRHEFRALLDGRCCDQVMIDQDLGLTGFLQVAQMAAGHGRAVVNHLAPETLSHPIAALPNGLMVGLVPWAQPLFTEPMRIEDGELVMPQTPGLGLTLNEEVLRACSIS